MGFSFYHALTREYVDPFVEGETCADIKEAWFERLRHRNDYPYEIDEYSEYDHYFGNCSVRASTVSIIAITSSLIDHKGVECWLLMEAAQAATEDNLTEIRVHVKDFDGDERFYSEARCRAT